MLAFINVESARILASKPSSYTYLHIIISAASVGLLERVEK